MRTAIRLAVASTLAVSLAAAIACDNRDRSSASASSSGSATAPDASSAGNAGAGGCSEAVATGEPRLLGNGRLSADELRDFYHLSEGSEIFPLAWLRALRDPRTNEKLFDHLDRYGFLPDDDPANTDHLPIGMTKAETRDSSLFDLEMFGFNCAACHVGQLQAEGKVFRIVGAPNLADVHTFLHDFATDLAATVGDLGLLLQFLKDVQAGSASQTLIENPSPAERTLVATLPKLDALKAGSHASQELAARIQTVFAAEHVNSPTLLGQGLVVQPPAASPDGGAAAAAKRLRPRALPKLAAAVDQPAAGPPNPKKRTAIAARFPAETPATTYRAFLGPRLAASLQPADGGAGTGLEKDIAPMAAFDAADQTLGVSQFLAELVATLRLLEQRLEPLLKVGSGAPETNPGPGRVDAFMTAHDLIFPSDPAEPMTSPVDYPRLWNLPQMKWLHWDGNTTSVLERNVGQALGVGAVFDPATHASTIRITNIHRLEEIAKKIDPPAWPFTAPDPTDVDAGERLYRARCAGCHDTDQGTSVDAGDVGTDRNRADSFAHARAKNEPFATALDHELRAVIARAFADEDVPPATQKEWETTDPIKWRITDAYVARGLVGAWATAPYLHNGSVPTLDDLLSAKRPPSFWIGDRRLDVARGGYCATSGAFLFDAGAGDAGNSNAGHEYGTDLDADGRRALVAYIESLR
jgi:mono/diheme cytochrome c family protein